MKQIDVVAQNEGPSRSVRKKNRKKLIHPRRNPVCRILVPVDFSPVSLHALDYAARHARETNAEILLLHVRDPVLTHQEFVSPKLRALRAEARRDLRKRLALLSKERLKEQRERDTLDRRRKAEFRN